MVLRVQRQSCVPAALAVQAVGCGHFHRLRIDYGDAVLVLDINVDSAFAVGCGLLRCAAEVDRAEDLAVIRIDDGGIRCAVAEDVAAMIECVVQDAVRPPVDIDGLDQRQRLRVPHRDRFAGGESVVEFCVRCRAASVRHRNLAGGLERVEVIGRDTGG